MEVQWSSQCSRDTTSRRLNSLPFLDRCQPWFSPRRTVRRTSHMRPLVATPDPWHYLPKPARTSRGNPMKLSFVAVLALALAAIAPALADDKTVKIGVLTDLS